MSGLLGPNGTPMVDLGGSRAWRVFTKGDIVVSLQWLDTRLMVEDSEGVEPVLAIFPANRRVDGAAAIIRAADAHAYITSRGWPTMKLAGWALKFMVAANFNPQDKSTRTRIFDAVYEAMPDLIRMPSEQPDTLDVKRLLAGIEATMQVNGKTVAEEVF